MLGIISWAELGAALFASMLLWVTVAPLSDEWLPPLWWLSMFVLPFTLWSLLSQAFIIRKWCLFCCALVFLLWTNAAILLVFHPRSDVLSIPNTAILSLLFSVSLIAIIQISKTIGSKASLYAQQRETAKIKYNFRTIQSHLSDTSQPFNKAGLSFSNTKSPHDFGLYVSIGCSHCGRAVKEFRRMIEVYPNFDYRLIFFVNPDDKDDRTNVITRHLLNLYKSLNKNGFFDVLDTWYSMQGKTIEALQKSFPASSAQDCQTEMDALYQFIQQNKISYTPALLLNGRLLSQVYSYKDLFGIARTLNCEE